MFWETLLKTLIMMKSGEKAIKILKIECLDVGNIFFWCRMERPWRMTLRPLREWNLTGVTSHLTSWTLPKVWYSVSKANIQQGMKLTRRKKSNVFHLKQTDKKIIQIFLSTSEYSRLLKSSCLQISVHLILAQITKENLFPLPTELSLWESKQKTFFFGKGGLKSWRVSLKVKQFS